MLCSLQASQFYTAIYLRGVLLYLIKDIFNEKFKKTLLLVRTNFCISRKLGSPGTEFGLFRTPPFYHSKCTNYDRYNSCFKKRDCNQNKCGFIEECCVYFGQIKCQIQKCYQWDILFQV